MTHGIFPETVDWSGQGEICFQREGQTDWSNQGWVIISSLKQLIDVARENFAFKEKDKLILMLEEDETEVQDEDYFHHIYMMSSLKQLTEVAREKLAFKEKDKLIVVTKDES